MPARGRDVLAGLALEAMCRGLAFHVLSYYEEDTGREASVRLAACGKELVEIEVVDETGCDTESLAAAERSLPVLLSAPVPRLRLRCGSGEGERYDRLTAGIASAIRSAAPVLARLASEPREYFYVAGWNGEYALGPGSEDRVSLPLLPAPLFIHTHPAGSPCYPSSRDLGSAAEFYARGGLVEAIVSASCVYVLRLARPLDEDCYDGLLRVSRCVAEAGGDAEEYLHCLTRLPGEARCVAAELL